MIDQTKEIAAALLVEVGSSYRQAAAALGISDRAVAAIAKRGAAKKRLTAAQKAKVEHLTGYLRWMREGEERGYLGPLVSHVAGLKTHGGRDGVKVKVS